MSEEKSKEFFLGEKRKEKLNCGQAIISAFRDKFGLTEETVRDFRKYGGGRAPEGVCGALYALRHILYKINPGFYNECRERFIARGGSDKCREIRKIKKMSCLHCVETAARCLENIK